MRIKNDTNNADNLLMGLERFTKTSKGVKR